MVTEIRGSNCPEIVWKAEKKRRPDEALEWNLVDTLAVVKEMTRRVRVRARVRILLPISLKARLKSQWVRRRGAFQMHHMINTG